VNSAGLPAYPFRSDTFSPLSEKGISKKKVITPVEGSIKPDEIVLYKSTKQGELNQHVFLPKGHKATDKRTAVVCFYGGGWVGGTPRQFYTQAKALTAEGAVVFCAEYRVIKKHKTTPFTAVKDGKSSIRWVRENAEKWGVDPDKIVAIGGSAGGHIAACTGIIEGLEEEEGEHSKPNAMVLFNPVLDTTEKGYGKDKFPSNDHLDISPCHQVKKGIVPTLVLHGTSDEVVPHENAERFTRLMKEVGNDCTLISYEGAGHGFFNSKFFRQNIKDESNYHATLKEMIDFLKKKGFLK